MASTQELKDRVFAEIDARSDEIVGVAREILAHPEAGYREVRTGRLVAERLRSLDIECREGLALTGVKGSMAGRERWACDCGAGGVGLAAGERASSCGRGDRRGPCLRASCANRDDAGGGYCVATFGGDAGAWRAGDVHGGACGGVYRD